MYPKRIPINGILIKNPSINGIIFVDARSPNNTRTIPDDPIIIYTLSASSFVFCFFNINVCISTKIILNKETKMLPLPVAKAIAALITIPPAINPATPERSLLNNKVTPQDISMIGRK